MDAASIGHASVADLPSLDRVLRSAEFSGLLAEHGRTRVAAVLRSHLAGLRARAADGPMRRDELRSATLAAAVTAAIDRAAQSRLRPLFNLTGTVLHTNFGRALLPAVAADAVARAAATPVSVEFDLDSGRRGDRDAVVAGLLRELTGAEDATVVNNNAAAVLLLLHALAARREVVISRGELVEIGGSFRIPDVMRAAGARLVEVGTTNRTHLSDYSAAIGSRTALLMKVHTSNYAISGFTASVGIDELAALAHERGLPTVVDLGSGSLVDLSQWGLPQEPTVGATLAAGADLVAFSGDKLLGGPQAGILAGRAELIATIKKSPLKRALRVDKLTLAALEAVLGLYREPERLAERLPTLRLLTRDRALIEAQAERLLAPVKKAMEPSFAVSASAMASQIGSGALPVDRLDSHGFSIRSVSRRGSLVRLQAALRALPRPVIGRIADAALWLDLRCLEQADEADFVAQLEGLRP